MNLTSVTVTHQKDTKQPRLQVTQPRLSTEPRREPIPSRSAMTTFQSPRGFRNAEGAAIVSLPSLFDFQRAEAKYPANPHGMTVRFISTIHPSNQGRISYLTRSGRSSPKASSAAVNGLLCVVGGAVKRRFQTFFTLDAISGTRRRTEAPPRTASWLGKNPSKPR
jgi:hypothetical protein